METGILGYGFYVPKYRIRADEYFKNWGYFAAPGVSEKAVGRFDEDVLTMAVNAAQNAVKNSEISSDQLNGVYLATTSSPYAEKLGSSTISSALGAPQHIALTDFGASAKAGTSALLCGLDFILSGRGKYGLVVASESLLGDPRDAAEHPLGAAAAALIVGRGETSLEFEGAFSVGSEMWGGRYRLANKEFSTELGIARLKDQEYNDGVLSSIRGLMKEFGLTKDDFTFIVLQQPDGRLPFRVARQLGIKDEKIISSMIAPNVGDVGAVSVLLGLAPVFDMAKPKDRILMVSHGSGMGSDALSLVVHEKITEKRLSFSTQLQDKQYIDYVTYLKWKKLL